ncbi:MAG: H(+)-transporting ATPase [Ruminococcus sp.]|nr:H(+)-transporting ATPase [Ruminococcus sp.]
MAGIDNILKMIASQQEKSESLIISSAKKQADSIMREYAEKAEREYNDFMKKSAVQLEQEKKNFCSSTDGEMKRVQLAYKVEAIDEVIAETLRRLNNLPVSEYFAVLQKLLSDRIRKGNGELSLNALDLMRMPESFRKYAVTIAEKSGGTLEISENPADIENGFILTYGLISENCSFSAIIEAEYESVRDIAAKALFG